MNDMKSLSPRAAGLIKTQSVKPDTSQLKANALAVGGADPDAPRGINYVNFNGNNGAFTFGKTRTEIHPDQKFVVPMESLKHGWVFWQSKQREQDTEVMVSAFDQKPSKPDHRPLQGELPSPRDRDGWAFTISFDLYGMGDLLDGMALRMQHTSKAITQCWGDIAYAIADRDEKMNGETDLLNPIVTFKKDSYMHKSYDREVHTLAVQIVGWTDGFSFVGVDEPQGPNDPLLDGDTLEEEDDILN